MKTLLALLLALPAMALTQYTVCSSGCTYSSLQTAITAAQTYQDGTLCEEVLLILTAGETFSGNFTIPSKSCAKYVTIRSSAQSAVSQGTRAGSSHTASMALVRSPNTTSVIDMAAGGYWRFQMIEFTKAGTGALMYALVKIANSSARQLAILPHHVIFDRVYIHGVANAAELIRGIHLAARNVEIVDSTISDIYGQGIETQAIWCELGCQDITVVNSLISAATENFLAGGNDGVGLSDTTLNNHPQMGFVFKGNHFYKDPSWKRSSGSVAPTRACLVGEYYLNTTGSQWYICTVATGTWNTTSAPAYASTPSQKNLFELKDGRRIKIVGNYFENSWDQAQPGAIILVNQTGQTVLAHNVEDVEFAYNRGAQIGAGYNYGNLGYLWTPGNGKSGTSITRAKRHNIHNNLITGFFYGGAATGGSGRLYTPHTNDDMVFRHNTTAGSPTHGIINNSDAADNWRGNFQIIDNVFGGLPNYAWIATGAIGGSNWCGLQNLVMADGGSLDFRANALVGGSNQGTTCTGNDGPQLYTGTRPATAADLFTNPASDWSIKSGSPAENAATDGLNLGADMSMVNGATSTVASGTLSTWHNFRIRSVIPTASGAAVHYSAPDLSACTVEVSTADTFASTVGSVSQASVGLSRIATITGLSADTLYWVRAICGSYTHRQRFSTL